MRCNASKDLFAKVVQAVEQTIYIDGQSLTPASRLVDDLQIGRFGRIRLALYLEETFDVEIPDESVDGFHTVGDILSYVNRWSLGSADLASYVVANA